MAWLESHQGIERHPKTMKLSLIMGWDLDQTIGKLHRFWWWCLDFAPDGNVSRHSADMAALSVGIPPELGEKFISAMYKSEFLDKTSKNQFLIHDWLEYAGRYLRDTKFRRNPEKLKEIIALYATIVSRQSADKKPTKSRKSAESQPYLPNLPNLPNIPKNKDGAKVSAFVLPDWIDSEVWKAFEEMRSKIKKPMTDRARKNIVMKLEDFKSKGYDPTVILDDAITGSWQSVYEPKGGGGNSHEKHRPKSFAEQDRDKQQQIRRESQRQAGLSREDVEIFGGDQPESMDGSGAENALPVGVGRTP